MSSPEDANAPTLATGAVLVKSEPVPEGTRPVKGVEFNDYEGRDITAAEIVNNMASMGFQASAVGEAARIINEMVRCFLVLDMIEQGC